MAGIEGSYFDVGRTDLLARQDTPAHRLDPRAKLVTTVVFLFCVVSFGKYEISGMVPFLLYPAVLAGSGHIPFRYVARRVLIVAPFALMVGIFNPLIDRGIMLHLGPLAISGGWVSFTSILLRFCLTIGTVVILIAVTSFDRICLALSRLGFPKVFTIQLLFLYRYIFVLLEEAVRLVRARALRSFGKKGMGIRVYGNLVGHLLIRTLSRARRIHLAMCCRGFTGEVHSLRKLRMRMGDILFTGTWVILFLSFRFWNLPRFLEEILRRFGV